MTIGLFFPIFIFLFILALLLFGANGAMRAIPAILVISGISSVFIWFVAAFFPLILIYIIYNYIRNQGKPKKSAGRTKTYYYSSGNAQDFEEFFRRAGGNQNFNNFGGNQGNPYTAFEDKGKYYRTLGVQEGASKEEIKKAFRSQARQHHPDKYATADEDIKNFHEKKFKEINEAYDKLSK